MRIFPSGLSKSDARIYRVAAVFFLAAFLAMLWPVYPFFSRVRPFVLGMPFALAYLIFWLVMTFFVLLGLYLRQSRRGELDE